MEPQFRDIEQARDRLKGVVFPSPLIHSSYFSSALGAEVFLKMENLQETGSFKVRGAYNRLGTMTPEERGRGVRYAIQRGVV